MVLLPKDAVGAVGVPVSAGDAVGALAFHVGDEVIYESSIAAPCQIPDAIVPTLVSDDPITPDARVDPVSAFAGDDPAAPVILPEIGCVTVSQLAVTKLLLPLWKMVSAEGAWLR